ncbi:MAG: choice-of-anchor D domain-containing protein [Chloroflexi bacterium]|nr:choice-of-anchor D domain-containing protein [Chloroflexota bacterium]
MQHTKALQRSRPKAVIVLALLLGILVGSPEVASPSVVRAAEPWQDVLSVSDLDIGAVGVGGDRSGEVRLTNSHPTERAHITDYEIGGPGAAAFTITQTPRQGPFVREDDTAVVLVDFSPTAPGTAIATLTISYRVLRPEGNSPTQQASGTLTGTGILAEPALRAIPAALHFGNIDHDAQPTRTVSIRNTSDGVITMGRSEIAGHDLSLSQGCWERVLAPGDECVLTVKARRTGSAGPLDSRITVRSDDVRSPLQVPIDGVFLPGPTPSPDTTPPSTPDTPIAQVVSKAYRSGKTVRLQWLVWSRKGKPVAYQAQWRRVGDGAWTTGIDRDTPLTDLRFSQSLGMTSPTGTRIEVRARSFDAAGNASAWSPRARIRVAYRDLTTRTPGINGRWRTVGAKGKAFGGSLIRTTRDGMTVRLTFTGRTATLLARTGPTAGQLRVFSNDGTESEHVSLHGRETRDLVPVWTWHFPDAGTHTVRIQTMTSGGRWIALDGLVVTR